MEENINDNKVLTPKIINQTNSNLTWNDKNVKADIPKYLEHEELMERLKYIQSEKTRFFLTFLYMTGIRVSEAVNLKKSDIDFKNEAMTVKWQKSRKYNYRVVPIHKQLMGILRVYAATLKETDRLFPFTRFNAWYISKKHIGVNPHALRHSFAVHWLRSGGNIVTLHRIMGHSKIQTTMEYLKIVPLDQQKELNKINFI